MNGNGGNTTMHLEKEVGSLPSLVKAGIDKWENIVTEKQYIYVVSKYNKK